jgi:hypothetical protein
VAKVAKACPCWSSGKLQKKQQAAGSRTSAARSSEAHGSNCKRRANASQTNADGDPFGNACDNCSLRANPDQRDTEGDGFDNVCDPDFNSSFRVDSLDASLLKSKLGSTSSPHQDLDGNGTVDASDMAILKAMFGGPPGPGVIFD